VVYFVDPRYAADRDAVAAGPITLSYTFFPAVTGARAEAPPAKGALGAAPRAGL
jgi:cytochrome c oxidase assembly protein Cox11